VGGPAPKPPPPAGPTGRIRKQLPTIAGLVLTLAAVAVYLHFFLSKPPASTGPSAVARLSAVEGAVSIKAGGQAAWTEGKSQVLRTGDVVRTDPKAGAEITFFSGDVVRVSSDSVVLISAGGAAVAEEATAWHVQSGKVSFDLKQSTDIVTPTARTRATANSTGNIDVTEGRTGVKIFTGSAEVATALGQKVTLGEREAVLVDAKGRAGAKVELPPPPTLLAPPGQAELTYVAPPTATARLTWAGAKGAATYHVAIDYNVKQAELLLSAALNEPSVEGTSHDLTGLDPGRYFWRVAGVSEDGWEGDFSRMSLFSVVKRPEATARPSAAPKLIVQVSDLESVLEVNGRTDPGAAVTVDGHEVTVLPDGGFNEHVRKSGGPFIVVRATAPDGQFAEERRPVPAR
jgi:hypothetical protein